MTIHSSSCLTGPSEKNYKCVCVCICIHTYMKNLRLINDFLEFRSESTVDDVSNTVGIAVLLKSGY